MKQESRLHSNLKAIRTRFGMSQQELARLSGVTRQTVSGVESGLFAPSAAVALRLARALGCRVEDLFWLDDDLPEIEAVPAAGLPAGEQVRLALGRVGGQWVAHPLVGDAAFRTQLVPADGEGCLAASADRIRVKLLDDPENLLQTVLLAGCTPALSVWAQAAERWHPGLRVHWTFANSMAALASLGRGEVHAAGVHLYDPETGEHNTPFVRRVLGDRPAVLINLGIWEEGLLVRPGNPSGLMSGADLAQPGVSIVNRETGSGSRQLLERTLLASGVDFERVQGFSHVMTSHIAVAREVAEGRADAAIAPASVAAAFRLGFVPLHRVRYDMAVLKEHLDEPPVRHLLATLAHRRVRSQLQALGGYDTSRTGDVVATIEPAAAKKEPLA